MTLYKKEKMEELLHHLAAEFFKKESGPQSLITVTGTSFDKRKNSALILISIFPKEKGNGAFTFVERKKRDFIDYLKKHSRIRTIPFISFVTEKESSQIDG